MATKPKPKAKAVPSKGGRPKTGKPPLKERASHLVIYVNPEGHRQLKELAARLSKPGQAVRVHDLALEGLNLVFREHNLPENARCDDV